MGRPESAPSQIFVSAGEPSGDQHAAAVVRAYAGPHPDVSFVGLGGPELRSAGVELWAELDRLAVMGIAEVAPKLPFFLRLERRIRRYLDETRPAALFLVDYPAFNLRLARAGHERGIPVVWYIAPKVWAWGQKRARALAEYAARVAVIFPFEIDLFASHGADARYVGHPLLDRADHVDTREAFLDRWGLDPDRRLLALLPGSREQEIRRHLDLFADVAGRVRSEHPDVLPVFSRAASVSAMPFHDHGLPTVTDTWGLLRHASVALVKSGTATLEAALERTPMVIAYKTSPVTAAVARRALQVDDIGLPNLVAGRRIVPEFVQEEAEPERIADALIGLLDEEGPSRQAQRSAFDGLRTSLGEPGAAERVAALLDEVVR